MQVAVKGPKVDKGNVKPNSTVGWYFMWPINNASSNMLLNALSFEKCIETVKKYSEVLLLRIPSVQNKNTPQSFVLLSLVQKLNLPQAN